MNDRAFTAQEQQVARLSDMVVEHEKILQEALPEGMSIRQVMRDALQLVQKTPKLAECSGLSVIGGLVNCAQLGLRPGVGALGHAWLIPMWNHREGRSDATLIIGYRGYVTLAYRDPAVQAVAAHCVYTKDTFHHVLHGARGTVEHRMAEGDRGLPDKYYAAAVVRGVDIVTETWTQQEMNTHRDKYALARNRKGQIVGPWAPGPGGAITRQGVEMGKKTMVRGPLAKMIPATWQLLAAGAIDDGGVRVDIDPNADPVDATDHPNRPEQEPETDPTMPVRESVTLRQAALPTGGITGEQDRTIARLMRDRKMTKDAALDLVETLFGERKTARQLTEEQADRLIAKIKTIPVPTVEGVVVGGRPVPQTEQPRQDGDEAARAGGAPSTPTPPGEGQSADASPLGPGRVFTPENHDEQTRARKYAAQQMRAIHALMRRLGINGDDAIRDQIAQIIDRPITSRTQITYGDAGVVIAHLENRVADELRQHIITAWRERGGADADLAAVFAQTVGRTHAEAYVRHLDDFADKLTSGQVPVPGVPTASGGGGPAAADDGHHRPGRAADEQGDDIPDAVRLERRIREGWSAAGGSPARLARVFFERTGVNMGEADESTLEAFLAQVTSRQIMPEGGQPPA